jgi:hypothetical protein
VEGAVRFGENMGVVSKLTLDFFRALRRARRASSCEGGVGIVGLATGHAGKAEVWFSGSSDNFVESCL